MKVLVPESDTVVNRNTILFDLILLVRKMHHLNIEGVKLVRCYRKWLVEWIPSRL